MSRVERSPKAHDQLFDRVRLFLNPLLAVLRFLKCARRHADGVNSSMCVAAAVVTLLVSVFEPLFFHPGSVLAVVGAALTAGTIAKRFARASR